MSTCNECSVKLVEQELWQREDKGLIGILPVRDAAETEVKAVGPTISQDGETLDQSSKVHGASSDSHKLDAKAQNDVVHWHNRYSSSEFLLRHFIIR